MIPVYDEKKKGVRIYMNINSSNVMKTRISYEVITGTLAI